MRKIFDFYSDPSHGWLKVKKSELKELGIEKKITGYSYQKGEWVYLEEDCDASIFLDAFEKIIMAKYKIKNHISDKRSEIRSYATYTFRKGGK